MAFSLCHRGDEVIQRLTVWGGRENQDSFRWIQQAYHQNALKIGVNSQWLPNTPESANKIQSGDTVICPDVFQEHLPYVEGARYVLHNFDGSSPICRALEDKPQDLLRLQVWTTDATGERWDTHRSFDREARVLFQPWGSDILAEEFQEPVFNPQSREVVFIGAIWSDQYEGTELGNEGVIAELKDACKQNGMTFTHRTQVSSNELMHLTRTARLAPTVVGNWQCGKGYLPCRAFKNSAYGVLMFSNSAPVTELFDGESHGLSVGEMMQEVLRLKQRPYLDSVREQQKVAAKWTYRESLQAIDRAFEAIQ